MSDTPADQTWPLQPERLRPPSMPAQLMRASDADRDEVVRALADAFAVGRLTRDEHDERLSRALAARTLGELAPLTHDLQASPAPAPSPWIYDPAGTPAGATVFSFFGGSKRAGRWLVPQAMNAVAIFGGSDLDLRDATFTAPVVDLNVTCVFGGVNVIVPEGVAVDNHVIGLFGGVDTASTDPQPGAPTVRLRGLCLFGGVNVKVKKRRQPPAGPAPAQELR